MEALDPELAAQAFLGMFFAGVVAAWAAGAELPFDREAMAQGFSRIFARGVARRAAGPGAQAGGGAEGGGDRGGGAGGGGG